MIIYEYGKKINSTYLKKDLNKKKSVEDAKNLSLSIKPGIHIESCPICNTKENKYLQTVYGFTYYECENCSVVYVSNTPSEDEIEKVYRTEYYSNMNKTLLANDNIIDYRVENIAKPKVEYILKNLTTNKKRWLDIGCGVGEILSIVSAKDWDTLGIETNGLAKEYGIRRFGLNIIQEYIDETNIHKYSNKYGVISLFGVLEHLKNPHSMIKNISLLQERGDNFIIEVPHFPSISAICQITFPDLIDRIMHPPIHLFLFSLKSLEVLLNMYRYKINYVWFFGQDFYEFLSSLTLLIDDFNNSILYDKMSFLINDFQYTIDNHGLSDEILIISEKIGV